MNNENGWRTTHCRPQAGFTCAESRLREACPESEYGARGTVLNTSEFAPGVALTNGVLYGS